MAPALQFLRAGEQGLKGLLLTIWLALSISAPVWASSKPYCPWARFSADEQVRIRSGWGEAKGHHGHFTLAPRHHLGAVEQKYLQDKARPEGLNLPIEGKVERFQKTDLDVDFNGKTDKELQEIRDFGLSEMAHSYLKQPEILKGTPYGGFSRFHYFTSGAGLWSRGGGTVKALLPLNLKELLTPAELGELTHAGDIVAAKGPEEIFKIAGISGPADPARAEGISQKAVETIRHLTNRAMKDPRAVNVLDVKFANVALLSQQTGSYIHFDVWTSEQTHPAINEHMARIKSDYMKMRFHSDPKENARIQKAIGKYVEASERLNETHLFGYQEGIYPLDPKTGRSLENHAAIGEGAGMAKHYLDQSGRSAILADRGTRDWVFQNIEVTSDLALEYGAYRQSGRNAAAVLVPTAPGYAGGSPYIIRREDGSVSKQLIEGSAVSKELRDGNPYFNSNTIYQSTSLKPPQNVGYETKDNGRIVRLKMNAGDITLTEPSAMIGGRAKEEYENFKTYAEYSDNGEATLQAMRRSWVRQMDSQKE